MSLLKFQDVSFIGDSKAIVSKMDFAVETGDYVSIVGPSGGGKSTFLKLCCHLISPTSGTILYKDKPILEYDPLELRKNIAYCFQTPHLFGKTVMDNFAFPYEMRKINPDIKRIEELLVIFNLDSSCLERSIVNLSGGEKQRIALIRTLLFQPEILLLDEVTSALDEQNTATVEEVVKSFHGSGSSVLWVTHNPEQSKKNANKVLTLEAGKIKSVEVLK